MSLFSQTPAYAQAPAFPRHIVTAILVAHDGARWLPGTLSGLTGQERPVQRVVAVDTGSTDATPALLADALGASHVVTADRHTPFGAAVAEALRTAPPIDPVTLPYRVDAPLPPDPYGDPDGEPPRHPGEPVEWLWLLHDDSEPAPDALHLLLRAADELPSAGVLGPKVRSWYDRRQLLEVGTTVTRSGKRWTGLERREQDQGQHDAVRGVLAVSSAGMLVRRDVWERLGGFDPRLPLARDDTDFCWRVNAAGHRVVVVPDAVVRHAEAATRERRPIDVAADRPHRVDRAGAAYTLLANTSGGTWPLVYFRLLFGGLLRSLGYLLGKLPGLALDELLGTMSVVLKPGAFLSARKARAATRTTADGDMGDLFPSRAATIRLAAEGAVGNVTRRFEPVGGAGGRHGGAESGPVSEEAEALETEGFVRLRAMVKRPGLALAVALTALTLISARGLLGGGSLMGGALLPAPEGAADLWRRYAETWHGVGLGEASTAPPYLAALGALAGLLFGKATTAVSVLLIGSVPLAGLTAYLCARSLVASSWIRAWGAAAYALTPVASGAVATGRVGTAAVLVLAPIAARGAAQVIGGGGLNASFRSAWATGFVLALMAAFVPLVWIAALVLAVAVVVASFLGGTESKPGTGLFLRLAIVVATPALLLGPWTLALLKHPSLFLSEPGLTTEALADHGADPVGLLLLDPGGPTPVPVWVGVGVLLAALAALLRDSRRQAVLSAWAVAVTGLVIGIAVSRAEPVVAATGTSVPAWPGVATVLIAMGYIAAAMVGAEDARTRVAASSFGWRQPAAVALTAIAALTPVIAAVCWVWQGAAGPVERRDPVVVPAFVASEAGTSRHPRTLVLSAADPANVSYQLVRGGGPVLGDADTAPDSSTYKKLDTYLGDLLSGAGGAESRTLATYGIGFIQLKPPVNTELKTRLDGIPGLLRVSAEKETTLWRLQYPAGRVLITDPDGTTATVPSAAGGVSTRIQPGPEGRLVSLAERADDGWEATLDGKTLKPRTLDGWAQGFELPASGGRLEISHSSGGHGIALTVQAVLVLVVFVLALPARRRGTDDDLPDAPSAAPAAGEGEGRRARRAREQAEAAAAADPNAPGEPADAGTDVPGPRQAGGTESEPVPAQAWSGAAYDGAYGGYDAQGPQAFEQFTPSGTGTGAGAGAGAGTGTGTGTAPATPGGPAYQDPAYQDPAYGAAPYGTPGGTNPAPYDAAPYDAGTYGAPGATGNGTPAYGTPAYGTPAYGTPAYGTPGPDAAGYSPGYDSPGYDGAGYGGYDAAGPGTPGTDPNTHPGTWPPDGHTPPAPDDRRPPTQGDRQ